jgi:hypothetical protein
MSAWNDWLTRSFFRIHANSIAAPKLAELPVEVQTRLRRMLHDITELVDLTPNNTGRMWTTGGEEPISLYLRVGRVQVRYSISEDTRSLTIEDVIPLDDEEPLGKTG